MAALNTTKKIKNQQQIWFTDAYPVEWNIIKTYTENSAGFISLTVQNVSTTEQIIEIVFDNKPNFLVMIFGTRNLPEYDFYLKYDMTNTAQITITNTTI